MTKKILVLVFTNLNKDARVTRQVDFLKNQYDVTVAGYDAEPDGFKFIHLPKVSLSLSKKITLSLLLFFRFFKKALLILYPYEEAKRKIGNQKFDLIIANDVETLMLAFELANSETKIVFDAHEYAPRHFEDKLLWRLFFQPMNVFVCKKYIHRTNAMMTIGKGLANEYEKNFHVKPVVLTNANNYFDLKPSTTSESIRLVHHGIATPSRRLEFMIEMMDYLDERFSLDMYLLSEGFVSKNTIGYPERLKTLAARTNRVKILPPIQRELIVPTINHYDVGVFLIPPVNFNYENTLPNKFFDYIQARLAIAVGPTPEMAEIVNTHKLGVVSDDFTPKKLAEKINQLTREQIATFKQHANEVAAKLNAEENEKVLINLLEQVLNKN